MFEVSSFYYPSPLVLRKNEGELREIGISKTGEQSFLFLSSPLPLAFFFSNFME